jgi:hypothetical protein
MTTFAQPWLSEDEVAYHRMAEFHRQRVDAVASGLSPLGKREDGILVVHLIPRWCVLGRDRLDGTKLKDHGRTVPPLGCQGGGYTRFNVDGLLNYDGHQGVRAYSQLYRDGRLEAAMSNVSFPVDRHQKDAVRCLRDSACEQAAFHLVGAYLGYCQAVGLSPPIQMFSALVGCEGVRIKTDLTFGDLSEHGIDRSAAFLPDIEIPALDAEPRKLLRPWCDTLWQSCGLERSSSFDEDGNWRERKR